MNHPVVVALFPVVILIAIGFVAGRAGWVSANSTKDLSKLVFTVFLPPMLFRTMVNVHPENLQGKPLLAYVIGMALMYALMFFAAGRNRRAAVLGLAASYSNTVMIGIALIQFAYGEQGVAVLLALVAVALWSGRTDITDGLALVVVAARLVQSCIHLVSTRSKAVILRFLFMAVQLVIQGYWVVRLALI